MRNFYVFYINNEFKKLSLDNPYNLYKTMENIYYLEKSDLSLGASLFEQVAVPFKKEDVNKFIFENYKDDDFYINNRNNHRVYNKYRDETLIIKTHFAYLSLKTNISRKEVFKSIYVNSNLFVCDFENKDYFWLEKIFAHN